MASASELAMLIKATDSASGVLRNIKTSLTEMGSAAKAAQEAAGSLSKMGSAAHEASGGMEHMGHSAGGLRGILGQISQIATGMLVAQGVMAVMQIPGAVIGSAIEATASYERLGLTLETLIAKEMRSVDPALSMADALAQGGPAAKELLQWTQKLAIESPFTQETVADTLQTMMGYGMGSGMAKSLTEALTDMAAGSGKSEEQMNLLGLALGQVWAKGKLTGEEMRQLTDSGLGVADVAKAAGIPMEQFADAMAKGQISAKSLVPALIDLMKTDYGGAAKRQATSWAGLLSTFEDIKKIGLREFFEGTFKAIQPYVAAFVEKISSPEFFARLNELGQILGQQVGVALKWIATEAMPAMVAAWQTFQAEVLPKVNEALSWLGANVLPLLGQALNFVRDHWDAFKGALIGVAAVLGGAGLMAIIGAVVGLLSTVVGPLMLIAAAAGILGAAWSENWGGIRDTLTQIWNDQLLPALTSLFEWLKVNLPIAIQNLSDFWTGTLHPAILTVWQFINDNVFPLMATLFQWLGENIPKAIQIGSDFWQGVLLPAITNVWDFINGSVMPLLDSLANVALAGVGLWTQVVGGLWQNVLLPAYKAVYDFIATYLYPIHDGLSKLILNTVGPALNWLKEKVVDNLINGFNGLKDVIQWVIDRLNDLAGLLRNVQLPPWLGGGGNGGGASSSSAYGANSYGASSSRSTSNVTNLYYQPNILTPALVNPASDYAVMRALVGA